MAVVSIGISSNVSSITSEKRYPVSITIGQLKARLELITGASCLTVKLELRDSDNKFIRSLDNDQATLEDCGIVDGMIVHANDSNPSQGEFSDLSKVEKYEMSEEDYSKRADSVRAFKEKMKQQMQQNQSAPEEESGEEKKRKEEELAKSISVGQRCLVTVKKDLPKRGMVMFVGKTHFKDGYWVGVKYDEPYGKNDGSVEGKRYFECPMKYGSFVKPGTVQVGDYPELSLSDDEM